MMQPSPIKKEITNFLIKWSEGDRSALDQLFPLVYDELRSIAHRYMRRERLDHTLQTTALVNEAYLRLIDQKSVKWQNRAHFFAISAQFMRRILVAHARSHQRDKRGGGTFKVSLEKAATVGQERAVELIALDEALTRLSRIDSRRAEVVQLRFFGGLNNEEIAEVLTIHENTVTRDWNLARAWLYKELHG